MPSMIKMQMKYIYIYILNFIYPYINKFIICTQICAIYNSNLNKLEKMAKITASA